MLHLSILRMKWLWPFLLSANLPTQIVQGTTNPAPPEGLRADLTIGDGTRTTYHIGEIIPASLAISSSEHTKQWMATEYCAADAPYPTTTTPELSTRKGEERAALSSLGFCNYHGWGQEFDLAIEPWIRTMTLNHRFLLDQPGTYFLTWTGHWGQLP